MICDKPLKMECSAKDNNGNWVTNENQQGNVLTCRPNSIRCRRGRGLRCDTMRVRFLCPDSKLDCDDFDKNRIENGSLLKLFFSFFSSL